MHFIAKNYTCGQKPRPGRLNRPPGGLKMYNEKGVENCENGDYSRRKKL